MFLVLSILRCPDESALEERRFAAGYHVLGRGAKCDWVLADPERVLSSEHCAISFAMGAWEVEDLSSNGTFINDEAESIGRGHIRFLRTGDRMRLGAYEIECRIESAEFLVTQIDLVEGSGGVVIDGGWPPHPPPEPPHPTDGLLTALARIHESAGLPPPAHDADVDAALTAIGEALRDGVAGMRSLLIARAHLKTQFRIEQTVVLPEGNNPVKLAPTEAAAVLAALAPGGKGSAALREVTRDLTTHQLAMVSAMQAAAKAQLACLAPMGLEGEAPSGGIIPGAREKKLWEAYRKLHQQVTDQFEDGFNSVFGTTFARAYEEAARGGRQVSGR